MSEEEIAQMQEAVQRRKENKKIKDNLRTVLVRLALAEKKRNLYMQLISISSELKEVMQHRILNSLCFVFVI